MQSNMQRAAAAAAAAAACLVTLTALATGAAALPTQPQNPVIGIVSTPVSHCGTPPASLAGRATGCTDSYYVRWLEAAGVRVVNFPWNASGTQRETLLSSLNGVLFPGGGLGGAEFDEYLSYAQYIYNYAVRQAAAGDPFFVWGTCQGFQVLGVLAANNISVLTSGQFPGMYPLMMPLNFTAYQPASIMFGTNATAGTRIVSDLSQHATTLNWHHSAITPQDAAANPSFGAMFKTISTNNDPITGAEFISAFEATTANIFATQFHPERPPYEFSNDLIAHDIHTIAVSQYLSRFIVQRLRLNDHAFRGGATEAEKYMIERSVLVNEGYGSQVYWFD